MKRTVENWPVEKLMALRSRISFPEYQREKSLWATEVKIKLIDSILIDIDIPKLYFYFVGRGNYEVIDGQQRLWSIWEFLNGEFPYKVGRGGKEQYFSNLTAAQIQQIKSYEFQITVIEGADELYLRELFIRLQLGLLLNTGEKLHAATGKMQQFVFRKLALHPFIKQIGIPMRRYAKQTLCAQICINSFTQNKLGSFARTRYDDLEQFFIEYADPKGEDLDLFNEQSKRIFEKLDQLQKIFGGNAKNLRNRSYILSIYLFVEDLISGGGEFSADQKKSFSSFVFLLWKRLREESSLGIDRQNRELYSFQSYLSSAPGETYQIKNRHDKLNQYYEHFKRTERIKGDS